MWVETFELSNIVKHLILIFLGVSGIWHFCAGFDWVKAESRKKLMVRVQPLVVDKWEKTKGGGRGISYTLHVLELKSIEGCSCTGKAEVGDYIFENTAINTQVDALCYKEKCYHPDDRRWKLGYLIQVYISGFSGIVCTFIELFLLAGFIGRKDNS